MVHLSLSYQNSSRQTAHQTPNGKLSDGITFIFSVMKRKLDNEERRSMSGRVNEIKSLHKKALDQNIEAYNYDWQELNIAINEVLVKYKVIIFKDELEQSVEVK